MKITNYVFVLVFFGMIAVSEGFPQSLESITLPQSGRSMRASSGNPFDNADSEKFSIGESKTIALLKGPGKIAHIWLIPYSMDIRYPRAMVLRIYWDGASVPSVETPVGDFFAVGNGMQATVNSLPVKVSSYGRGLNCYWQMPFKKEAKITLTNESNKENASCYYQIDWVKYDRKVEPIMYFHARYHQEYPPEYGKPYTVFMGKGKGHYVGTVLSSQNGMGHWFGEGDDFFYIDGENTPSIVGTGTEDYFNEAWNMRVHSSLFTGCTVFEPRAPDARVTAYRWHIPDPILFNQSLKFEIERRGFVMDSQGEIISQSGYRPDFWSSVSYWYQETIAEPWCEFPAYQDRVNPEIVLHLPKVVDTIRHSKDVELKVNPYNRATYTKPWFQVKNETIGAWIEIPFQITDKGKYSMSLFQHLREDNGIWKVYIDGKELYEAGESHIAGGYRVSTVNQLAPEEINTALDFFNIYRKDEHEDYIYGQRRERKIGLFSFEPGEHCLKLVCIGANPLSFRLETGKPGYNLSADVLSLRKIPFEKMAEEWIEKSRQTAPEKPADNPKANDNPFSRNSKTATPSELWQRCRKIFPPLDLSVIKDEVIQSDSDPNIKLRRIEVKFYSQELNGKKWGHPCVIFLPADPKVTQAPDRRGKVVIVGQRSWDGLATGPWREPFLGNYGEPIAALNGYPTMICPVPGEYDDSNGKEISIGFLRDLFRETQDPINHNYFRLAIPYLRALDVMAEVLDIEQDEIRAVIGGHSKRATSAFTAAAIDPDRIVGLVYMGNESTWDSTQNTAWQAVCPAYTKNWVQAKVLYLGATNEDGYRMYGINRIQEIMGGKWTIEYIPNYRHASMSEKHFLDWRMWVSHVFENRPVTQIGDLSYREVEKGFIWGGRSMEAGTVFRARVQSSNKIIQAKVWYVYNDDEPYWRDLVWYPEFMVKQNDGFYEGYVKGKLPDAWLVEVKDTAGGCPGYVSSLPQDITGKRIETKKSRGSRSRHWSPKT
ncbi:MAG: DUF2961 domain-containing protein [Sedimentisphaerales bacterium]|nr:DUF2961 domain-containing protein [Sedimentisphaerales bacterium]